MINIRKARPSDAHAIAPIMLSAMEEIIYSFIGERDQERATAFLAHHIIQEGNQYSYKNIIVAESGGNIIGQICLYPGEALAQLREPIQSYLHTYFQRGMESGDETQSGEIYIDTLAVAPTARSKGIGKILLLYAIDMFVHRHGEVLGLLVEKTNPKAKSLYISIGFKSVGDVRLFGKDLEHLQYR